MPVRAPRRAEEAQIGDDVESWDVLYNSFPSFRCLGLGIQGRYASCRNGKARRDLVGRTCLTS